MLIDVNAERAKALAWSMKNYLARAGYEVPNGVMLEAFSQGIGYTNYRTLKAASKEKAAATTPDHREMARQLMKGDQAVPVRFEMHFLADSRSVESALMYLQAPDMKALLEARHQVLNCDVESVSVKPPLLAYEGDGPMCLEPSMFKVTREGIDFSVVMFYRGHHRSAHVKTWTLSALVDDMRLRTPGTVVDAGMSHEPEDDEVAGLLNKPVEEVPSFEERLGIAQEVSLPHRDRTGAPGPLVGEGGTSRASDVPADTGTALMQTRHLHIPLSEQLESWQERHLAEALREGWAVFDTAGVGSPPCLGLERDDEAAIFADDLEAWAHILKRASKDPLSAAFGALRLMTPRYEIDIRRQVAKAKRNGMLK